MRQLWFGGSFNPIHHGHLICARAVAESAGYTGVVLVPSGQSPHKPADASMATAADRLAMARLAVDGDPFFSVDDIEICRRGPSYTVDTIEQLQRHNPAKIAWLMGADMTISLPTWHEPGKLLAQAELVLMARPGWEINWSTLPVEYRHLEKNVVPGPTLDISSTMLRQRIARGQSIRYLTSDLVIEHIRQRGLYLP